MSATKPPKLSPAQRAVLVRIAQYGPGLTMITNQPGTREGKATEATAAKLEQLGLVTVKWGEAAHHTGRVGHVRMRPQQFTGITAAGRAAVGIEKFVWE